MNRSGFSKDGHWYRGNLHCHTTNTDGHLTPEQVADLYRANGYQFLAISDHDIYSDYRELLNREDFIILPALEASAVLYEDEGRKERLKLHHIHGILGTEEMRKSAAKGEFKHLEKYPPRVYFGDWDGAAAAQELSDDLRAHGCFTVYNHPIWSRVDEAEFIHTQGLTALEIYNYGTVNESCTGYDSVHWDIMLRKGYQILATATDDNHNDGVIEDSFGGFIVVKAEELSHESIVQGIINGNYYSSTGPEIVDWGIEDGIAYVECSPVQRVDFIAGNYINAGFSVVEKESGATITRAEFPLRGNEHYLRVQVSDLYGKTAWTNPMFF